MSNKVAVLLMLAVLFSVSLTGCSQVQVHARGDTQTSVGVRGGTSF